MDLKDKIIGMIKRSFGTKTLTSIDEIENIDTYGTTATESAINSGVQKTEQENAFNNSLKFDSNSIHVAPNFQKLSNEIRMELLENFEEFKIAVLESDDIKRIKATQEEGKMGETPFMCFAEMDSDGKLKSTIIVSKNSCIRTSEDQDGNLVYQETRMGKDGQLRTVLNDKNGSLYIRGKMSQEELTDIKKFSDRNQDNITKLPKRFDEQTRKEYKNVLDNLGVRTDINLDDEDKFKYLAAGKPKRDNDGRISELNEISFVLDKENLDSNPLIIALNTKKDNKIISKKFRLTESGKYIDESSFKMVDGKPQYSLLDYEQVLNYGKEKNLDVNYVDRMKKVLKDEQKSLIPEAAVSIHDAMAAKKEKEQRNQDTQLEEDDKTL